MRTPSKYLLLAIAVAASLLTAPAANAADETVTATTNLQPRSGPFFRESSVASNLTVRAEVNTPVSSPKVNPMKNVKVTFPAGMSFRPNNARTPVCTDAKLSTTSNLADPEGVLNSCRNSVVGTGTATIIIAKINNNPGTVVSDPILIVFNNGRTGQGQPRLKIYGYSKYTNVGILMSGTLRGRVLDIAVPVLSNDSAVRVFELNLPGGALNRPDIGVVTRGRDANYVQARCAASPLRTNAVFELGERTYPGGTPTTPTTTVNSPETTQNCNGQAGRARLALPRVNAPGSVRSGRVARFRVTVRNNGTATARNLVVRTNRGGKRRAGSLAPGASRTVVVQTRLRGQRNRRVAVRIIARAGNIQAAATRRVRIR
ncbi:MAG: hypothetical protein KDB52_02680 [Solirubrobacterales bacterium]|nr:hypothetical protein [Solirubrobacterales bacterium]